MNSGTDLYLDGSSTATDIIDQLTLTLYLQRWDGSQWVDVNSWVFNKYTAKSIHDGTYASYTSGNYYRTRPKIVRPLHKTDYNNWEFVLEDIDGRWIAFGMKQKQ